MLQITCPFCGVRDEWEFVFGGPSHITRPGPEVDDAAWTAYLFNRKNPAGLHSERWGHVFGCSRWFNVMRDTRTHETVKTYSMGSPPPGANDA